MLKTPLTPENQLISNARFMQLEEGWGSKDSYLD
uniref:Uncharacterized protein n=1 Tax=Anguilla anguilla TaxID=7936 RepID=A0A0E9P7U5_ANGAN